MLVHDALTYWGRRTPTTAFIESRFGTVSWGDADAVTNRIANALLAAGLRPGDRIAVVGPNEPEVPLLFFGALKAGVVPVTLNTRLAPPEWAYIIEDAGARAVFAADALAARLEQVRPRLTGVEHWASWSSEEGWGSLGDWASGSTEQPATTIPFDADACQLYTSGTTGKPKGAVLTHDSFAGLFLRCHLAGIGLEPGEVYYIFHPVTLAGGMSMSLTTWVGGATVRLADFEPVRVIEDLDNGVSGVTFTPTMLQMCFDVPGMADREYAKLRLLLYGGAPGPVDLVRRAREVFGAEFWNVYGQTEFFTVSGLTPADHVAAMNGREGLLLSVGRPLPGIEMVLLDPLGEPVPKGEEGELCVRGVGALREYWRDPDKTAKSHLGGYHHTGDIARIDDEGYVYLVDRANDMIKTGGLNVYPREVELVIEALPGVAQVAVIGVPSPKWGEEVKALVIRKPGSTITADDVITGCRGELGGFKVPKSVEFVEEFPLSALGKVVKHELRAVYQ